MLFNSGAFLYFFVAVYLAYQLLGHRWQNRLLLAASYFFYGYWDYRFLALILVSSLVDFTAGRRIEAARQRGREVAARRWLIASISVNLGILGFFKYFGFFADSLQAALRPLGLELSSFTLSLILPVGISFYTFQTLSYTIDVYRGRVRATAAFLDFCLFVSFFPQLMAGPIERFRNLFPQIQARRVITRELLAHGGWLLFWGLFKKVFIADGLAPYTAHGVDFGGAAAGLDAWLVMFAFAIRFYCDFSGYSDMAGGLAALMGFRLSRNFNLPYFARNPSELWARWHITLTNWFRDYVYGPLAKRLVFRGGRQLAALLTMTLVGLWHGAKWTFVIYGVLWGLAIVAHRLVRRPLARLERRQPMADAWLAAGGGAITFGLWTGLGCLFLTPSLARSSELAALMLGDAAYSSTFLKDAWTVFYYSAPLAIIQIAQRATGTMEVVARLPTVVRATLYFVIACLLLGAGAEAEREFLYFQF